jgi:magnesium and cobalt transporter
VFLTLLFRRITGVPPIGKGVRVSVDQSLPASNGGLFRKIRRLLDRAGRHKDFQQLLDEGEEQGLIDEDIGEMIEGIFEMKDTVAREIMIPRTHLVSLPVDATREEILDRLISSGHSRIPVYRDNVDHIVGILNAKDLLPLWLSGTNEIDLEALCRPPFFVPETKPISDLLNELRSKKSHMALIVDEYGGTAGIVTLEDIVEEIIGEIQDEYDVEENPFVPQQDDSVLVSARIPLHEFTEYFQVDMPKGDYDTIGGFIINVLGRVPTIGEELTHDNLSIRVQSGDSKRIVRLLVRSVQTEAQGDSVESSAINQ